MQAMVDSYSSCSSCVAETQAMQAMVVGSPVVLELVELELESGVEEWSLCFPPQLC